MSIDNTRRPGPDVGHNNSFAKIIDDTDFPAISVIRYKCRDGLGQQNLPPISSIEVFPWYTQLTHITNPEDISIALSAGNLNVFVDELEALTERTNVILESLTGINTGISLKIDNTNTLLNSLTSSSDTTNNLLTFNNTLLSTLTASNEAISLKLDSSNSKLTSLTAINTAISNNTSTTNVKLDPLTGLQDTTNDILTAQMKAPLGPTVIIDDQTTNTTSSAVDILGYTYMTVQVALTSVGTPTMTIQTSNDGVRWFNEKITDKTNDMVVLEGSASYLRTVLTINSAGDAGAAIVTAVR